MSLRQRLITAVIAMPVLCSTASAASTTWHGVPAGPGVLAEGQPAGLATPALPHTDAEVIAAIGGAFRSPPQRADIALPAAATASASTAHAVAIEPMPGPMYLLGVGLIGFGLVARRRSEPAAELNSV